MSDPTELTLDQMTDEMFGRLSKVIGESISNPSFSGFAIDEDTDSEGRVTKISFVPCIQDATGDAIRLSPRNAGIETVSESSIVIAK